MSPLGDLRRVREGKTKMDNRGQWSVFNGFHALLMAAWAGTLPGMVAAQSDDAQAASVKASPPSSDREAGRTEGYVSVGWAFVDFAGASAHQRGGDGYGVNNGQSLSVGFVRRPAFLPRLGLGASVRLTLTGASNEAGDRYFNPMSVAFLATYGLWSSTEGLYLRSEVGLSGVTRKLRSEGPEGVNVTHDFGIGWSAALGLGYRFPLPQRFALDVFALYERQGARVERSLAPSSPWNYGITSLGVAVIF